MRRSSRGFVSIEMMVVLIIIAIGVAKGTQWYMSYMDDLTQQVAAQQQQVVADAGSKYIKDNFAAVLAVATPTAPATITTTMLKNTKYLPTGFADQNVYGQNYQILARRTAAASNQLETLVVTTGGEAAGEIAIRKVAQIIGAQGGYISSDNTAVAQGLAWEVPMAGFGVSPGAGHLATALFFQDGAIVTDYLYRNAIPGHPELNVMNTDLGMGGNNINNAGDVNANGDVTAHNINADGNAEVDGQIYTSGSLRTRGDGGWTSEKWNGGWYMTDSTWVRSWANKSVYTGGEFRGGTLRSEGRTTVGEFLYLLGVAKEGTACSPNGLQGRKSSGGQLSCEGGIWQSAGVTLGAGFYGARTGYDPKDGGDTPYDVTCPGNSLMAGLRNVTDGDAYYLICRPL